MSLLGCSVIRFFAMHKLPSANPWQTVNAYVQEPRGSTQGNADGKSDQNEI